MNKPRRILIAEDVATDVELVKREIGKHITACDYRVVDEEEEFLAALETFQPDVVITDYFMPRFDGMRVLNLVKERSPDTPVIVITGSINEDTAVACMKAGAVDYVIKEHIKRLGPAVMSALEAKQTRQERREALRDLQESENLYRIIFNKHAAVKLLIDPRDGTIVDANEAAVHYYGWGREQLVGMRIQQINTLPEEEVRQAMERVRRNERCRFEFRHLRADGSIREVEVFSSWIQVYGRDLLHSIVHDITARKEAEFEAWKAMERLRRALEGSIQAISAAVEIRDPYTAGHQRRTSELAGAIAVELGLDDETRIGTMAAARIHDIGKISIPAEILSKPTKLTDLEFEIIKTHAERGYTILKEIEFPWPVAEIVYQHHERMNGSGYPRGLKGEEILKEARIIALADVVEAMSSHRPYRASLGVEAARREVETNRGILYDPDIVDAFLVLLDKGYEGLWKG